MAGKRKFTIKVDWAVIAELEAILKMNPQLGFKSTAEAAQHGIVFFTEDLKKRLGMTRLDPANPPPLNDLLTFIERYYKEHRVQQPPQKKPK